MICFFFLESQQSLLNSAIQKFKFEELESTVLPEFPEITWNQIRAYLIKNHESFTTVNVLKIINRLINVSVGNFKNVLLSWQV